MSFQMEFQYHFMKMEREKKEKNEILIGDLLIGSLVQPTEHCYTNVS